MSRGSRLLIVEDERDLAAGICENLEAEGYLVTVAETGPDGLREARSARFDLIILDVMLPELDGFEVCSELRARSDRTPVLFLTARGDPADRIRGLEEGGDDYMAKPFELRELLLRVAAILRRSAWYERAGTPARIRFGGNEVDLRRYRARSHDGIDHDLTHKEAMIMRLLAARAGAVVSRQEILDTVWGQGAYPTDRTVDNFIWRLRRRFETDHRSPRYFRSVHGVGYRFAPDGD